MSSKLKDRIESYQDATDLKMLERLPIVICLNGRSFVKLTSLLTKPYCSKLAECLAATTLKLCTEVEGCFFAYQFNDEIVLMTRNDQTNETEPWCDNRVQKICSITSSIASLHFGECLRRIELDLVGNPIFTANVFAVPNIAEAINTMIYKQQQNFHLSVQSACLYELIKKYDRSTIKEMLNGLTIDEKIDLLRQECEINFNDYPLSFRRGVAAYRVPKVIDGNMKNKWHINTELPIFTRDQSFLSNLFKMGGDMVRVENL
jgi:tRNA(His) guanylyltransferase